MAVMEECCERSKQRPRVSHASQIIHGFAAKWVDDYWVEWHRLQSWLTVEGPVLAGGEAANVNLMLYMSSSDGAPMLLLWLLCPTDDTPGIWPLPFFPSNGVATAQDNRA